MIFGTMMLGSTMLHVQEPAPSAALLSCSWASSDTSVYCVARAVKPAEGASLLSNTPSGQKCHLQTRLYVKL